MYHAIPKMVDSNPHTKRTETFTAPESGFLWLADVESFEEWDKSEKHDMGNTKEYPENVWNIVLQKGVTQHHTRLHISNTSNNPQPQKRTKKRDTTPKEALTWDTLNNYTQQLSLTIYTQLHHKQPRNTRKDWWALPCLKGSHDYMLR